MAVGALIGGTLGETGRPRQAGRAAVLVVTVVVTVGVITCGDCRNRESITAAHIATGSAFGSISRALVTLRSIS